MNQPEPTRQNHRPYPSELGKAGYFGYRDIADDLTARIRDGEYGYYFLTIPEISKYFGVAYQTAHRAVKVLEERQLVLTRYRHRTRVIYPGAEPADEAERAVQVAIIKVEEARKVLDGLLEYLNEIAKQIAPEPPEAKTKR